MKQIDRIKIWIKMAHPALDRERLKKEFEARAKRRDNKIKKRTQKTLFTSFDYL
jgi:hypothetical protein